MLPVIAVTPHNLPQRPTVSFVFGTVGLRQATASLGAAVFLSIKQLSAIVSGAVALTSWLHALAAIPKATLEFVVMMVLNTLKYLIKLATRKSLA